MIDGINNSIKPEYDYKQLLMNLTNKELQKIRKKWGFKGISHLNKEEVAEELSRRIPDVISEWLTLITDNTYSILKKMVNGNRVGLLEFKDKRDLNVIKSLQYRGVVFFGEYEEDILLVMPQEIKKAIHRVFVLKKELPTIISQNENLMLMCIGCLVYYGLSGIKNIYNNVCKYQKIEIDYKKFLLVLYEFSDIHDIFELTMENKLVLRYVVNQKWVWVCLVN